MNARPYYFILVILLSFLFEDAVSQTDQRGTTIEIDQDSEMQNVLLYKQSFALVVGVNEYSSGWPPLPGVLDDLRELSQSLKEQGFQVTELIDPDKQQLEDAIEDFIYNYGQEPDNRLLFYFAGHGYTIETTYNQDFGYIVPADAPNPNYDLTGFRKKAIELAQFELYSKQIGCKHAIFVFDACFSGSIFSLSRALPEIISYKTALPVRQFISSGSANETVPDKSIFREQFVSGINGDADIDHDGYVTGTELGEYLQRTVVKYSNNMQHPQYGKIRDRNLDQGDYVFVVKKIEKKTELRNFTDNSINIAAGPIEGTHLQLARDIKLILKDNVDIVPHITNGGIQNLRTIGNWDSVNYIGFIQSDNFFGAPEIDKSQLKVLFPLTNIQFHLLVSNDSDINDLEDCQGKRIASGRIGSSTMTTAQKIQEVTGIKWIILNDYPEDVIMELRSGAIDGVFFVGIAPIKIYRDFPLGSDKFVKFIPIDNPKLQKYYFKDVITAGTYKWYNEDIETYSTDSYIAANNHFPDSLADVFVSGILQNLEALQVFGHPAWKAICPSDLFKSSLEGVDNHHVSIMKISEWVSEGNKCQIKNLRH